MSQVREHRGVGPEGDDRQVIPDQFAGQRADRGRGGTDPLAAHGAGDVYEQHDRTAGPYLLADHDVLVLGYRVFSQLLHRAVKVDIVRAAPVADADELTRAPADG